MDFTMYQMDVKSAFLYGTIEEEVYVSQPLGFVDPEFLNKVYKVEKALYGLHQASRAWYETLSTYLLENRFRRGIIDKTLFIKKIKNDILLMSSIGELTFFLGLQVEQRKDGIFLSQDKFFNNILKKFGFSSVKTASTPMETHKPLSKDRDGTDVDVHLYRSMIGSLMYLTSSRPDIMFAEIYNRRLLVLRLQANLMAVQEANNVQIQQLKQNALLLLTAMDRVSSDSGLPLFIFTTVVISESSVRSDLLFDDEDGITCLTNDEIFENLTLIGYEQLSTKLTFQKAPEGEGSTISLEPQPTPSTSQPIVSEPQIKSLQIETPLTAAPQAKVSQAVVSQIVFHDAHIEQIPPSPTTYQRKRKTHKRRRTKKDTKLPQTSVPQNLGADEVVHKEGVTGIDTGGSPRCQETMGGTPIQVKSERVLEKLNEPPLSKEKIKKLEKKKQSSISHLRRRKYRQVETSSDDDLDKKDASKQGRRSDKIKPMFKDKDFEELDDHMDNVHEETVDATTTGVSTVSAPVTYAGMKEHKAKEKGVAITDVEDFSRSVRPVRSITTLQPLPTIDPKDKGKGVLVEEEPVKIKRRDQGKNKGQKEATKKYTIEERARLLAEFFEQRKKQLAAARAEAIRNKPPTKSQVRNRMITYLKHMGRYTHQQVKNNTYEEIQRLYEREKKWIDDFKPIDTKVIKDSGKKDNSSSKPVGGSRRKTLARKRTSEKQSKESAKRQKLEDAAEEQESAESDEEAAADYEQEKEELRMWLTVVPDEEETVDPEILSAKYPIFDWESHNLGSIDMEDLHVYKIIRADGNTSYHKSLFSMLRKFDKQDLVDFHRLVMKRFENTTPEGYNLLLWGDLKLWSTYIADGWYFDLLQHVSIEKVSSHQVNAAKDVELEARSRI
ncbi:retrovirus-related pol polyprotein from transposon TNT 1-94 [Tanacetum coccineum]